MIINKSGIVIRMAVAECRVMGRATQGVRLINLAKKNDVIASVCKVMSSELEAQVTMESRAAWAQTNEAFKQETTPDANETDTADTSETIDISEE
jgi:DNA gyrase subunit A